MKNLLSGLFTCAARWKAFAAEALRADVVYPVE